MNLLQPFKRSFPAWAGWMMLIFLAFTAPLIAACVQSIYVVYSDHWIYQATIGGAYFHTVEKPGVTTFLNLVHIETYGFLMFALLLAFRKRIWLIWISSILILAYYFYTSAPAIK